MAKIGLASSAIGDRNQNPDVEHITYTKDGNEVSGFASSVVPTLEEKVVMENEDTSKGLPPPSVDHKDSANTLETKVEPESTSASTLADSDGSGQEQARTEDGDLYGAPADASTSPKTDNLPPHESSGVNDAEGAEKEAPAARATLRKHLAAKLGNKTWTVPTRRPKVDPKGFEDPISDDFWKHVWIAAAAHNVCLLIFPSSTWPHADMTSSDRDLSQSVPCRP